MALPLIDVRRIASDVAQQEHPDVNVDEDVIDPLPSSRTGSRSEAH